MKHRQDLAFPRDGPVARRDWNGIVKCYAKASQVRREEESWLPRSCERIPQGRVTLLGGQEGAGKSLLCYWLTGRVSQDHVVLYSTVEELRGVDIRPRLEAAGAKLDNVHLFRAEWRFPQDAERFAEAVRDSGAALAVLDSGLDHMTTPTFQAAPMREAWLPVSEVAADEHVAVVTTAWLVKHPKRGEKAINAVLGHAGGLRAIVRVAYLIATNPDDEDEQILAPAKWRRKPRSLAFEIGTVDLPREGRQRALLDVPRFALLGESDVTEQKLIDSLAEGEPKRGRAGVDRIAARRLGLARQRHAEGLRRRLASRRGLAGLALVGVAATAAVAGCTSSVPSGDTPALGQAPPEWAANAAAWPAHNHDLQNTRATTDSTIDAQTVSKLKVKWRFPLKHVGPFGAFASTPIVLNGTVYLQDLNSNVYALDRSTGKVEWQHMFRKPSFGPNGVAFGYGRIYGATETNAFALNAQTGKQIWTRKLTRNGNEGIDLTPQVYDNTVLFSTVPGNATSFYKGNGLGVIWALDAATGKKKWTFSTVSDGAKLWGNPKINSGGGIWYPPAVDSKGRVFLSVANPAPLYGTAKFPNGSSRPGPNLYTDSLVVLNGATGKLLWYRQAIPHDLRDYDLVIPAILTTVPLKGVQTEIALVAGKMGKAFAYRADNGKRLWTISVGRHEHDTGPLPKKPITIYPGDLGGVETPMALADNRLFVPWLDLSARASATGLADGYNVNFKSGRGGLTAVNPATGKRLWERKLPSMDFGAATVANDVVFTSTYAGMIYGFDTQSGKTLWTAKAPAGINSFPAIDGDTLLVGAGAPGFAKHPQNQLIAYSLTR